MDNDLLISCKSPALINEYSLDEARAAKQDAIWHNLGAMSVQQAIAVWLTTLSRLTAKNYDSGMTRLYELGLLDYASSLKLFALVNHDAVIDRIKNIPEFSECSRQARAACYISFTRFLHRRTQGIIARALPNREGVAKTFFKVREKVATQAMSRAQWVVFLAELHKLNVRDCLIAKIMLQGGKRISEVLSLMVSQINFAERQITFSQSKTKGYAKETVITYPHSVMDELLMYVGDRSGLVFVTKSGKGLFPRQLAITFNKAGLRAGIPFGVTPHVLRASAVTYLKREGFEDSDIMKITGHASAAMVHAYDKSERADNATMKISLV